MLIYKFHWIYGLDTFFCSDIFTCSICPDISQFTSLRSLETYITVEYQDRNTPCNNLINYAMNWKVFTVSRKVTLSDGIRNCPIRHWKGTHSVSIIFLWQLILTRLRPRSKRKPRTSLQAEDQFQEQIVATRRRPQLDMKKLRVKSHPGSGLMVHRWYYLWTICNFLSNFDMWWCVFYYSCLSKYDCLESHQYNNFI